ncbi:ABC transporter permease [Candidatus Gottesmanbacteria bacterium]|nr:ABC transporter permease [Candidatus Gottesmanbacteria bacterium]
MKNILERRVPHFKQLEHFMELLIVATQKELQTRYRYTVFGFFWIVFIPLLQMVVIGFVFTFLVKEPILNYYAYLYVGLLIWNFFSLSLTKATPSIVYERDMVTRAKFPRSIIPLSIIASNFIHFALGLALIVLVLLPSGAVTIGGIFWLLIGTVWLLLFTTGISLLCTTLNVRYRDINFFVQAGLILWFYATPIVYPLSFIHPTLRWLWRFNPMTAIVELYHWSLLGFTVPQSDIVIANVGIGVGILVLGIMLFVRDSKNFADWI